MYYLSSVYVLAAACLSILPGLWQSSWQGDPFPCLAQSQVLWCSFSSKADRWDGSPQIPFNFLLTPLSQFAGFPEGCTHSGFTCCARDFDGKKEKHESFWNSEKCNVTLGLSFQGFFPLFFGSMSICMLPAPTHNERMSFGWLSVCLIHI